MKSKPSLRNSARPALLFKFILIPIFALAGCAGPIEPTYKEKDLAPLVKKICKDEYNLEVVTGRTVNTLWVYAPLERILHKEYGKKEDKVFDEEVIEKLRNILTTIGRVLISSDTSPEFFVLVASDTNIGLDYVIIANVLDIKKSYAGFIPFTEAQKRYLIKLKLAPEAAGDSTGKHVYIYNIELANFIAEQIAQRIAVQFQDDNLKKYFKLDKSEGEFKDGSFIFSYAIEETLKPDKNINVMKEILNTVTYCLKTYEFRNFSLVEINDLLRQDRLILSNKEVLARPMPAN